VYALAILLEMGYSHDAVVEVEEWADKTGVT
jgi:hypothetical protein